MNTENFTAELFSALAEAQAELENATKNSANPHFKSKYADLAEVLNTVRPVLAKHKIAVFQSTGFDGSMVSVETVLAHGPSGGFVSSCASCVPAKTDAQGVGAATTYLRRYALAAMCGVAQEDDDGNAASHGQKPVDISSWLSAISTADIASLSEIGSELSKAQMPQAAKATLRAAFQARRKELEAA